MPEPLTLRLVWDNGSLPPPHRRSGSVTLRADGSATVEATRGYDRSATTSRETALTPPEAEALAQSLDALGLWRTDWAEPERTPVGGSAASLAAAWESRTATVPHFVVPDQAEAKRTIVRAIRAAVRAEGEASGARG